MTPERWQRLKSLYDIAAGVPERDRVAFLTATCGSDTELKQELESLLAGSADPTLPLSGEPGQGPGDRGFERCFEPGELVLGRFRIVRLLGRGGMGEVYEANDLELGRIALKTIRANLLENPDLARFRKEVQLARRVSSPYVCRIHEMFVSDAAAAGQPRAFLTMEFLEGVTLADRIRESGPMPWPEAQGFAVELCRALGSIHEAGIVHRDVKSRNIMLVPRRGTTSAVLMDFGIAGELAAHGDLSTTSLTGHAILGTPGYMAPEQMQGQKPGPAADIYALGIVLHEMVTGRHPLEAAGANAPTVSASDGARTPAPVKTGLPRRCDEVLRRCLEYDPQRRYQSMAEVERALLGEPLVAGAGRKGIQALVATAAVVLVAALLMLIPPVGERVRGILFASPEKHIVVLPFEVAGGDAETVALGDGLMDSLAGKLSNLGAANQALWVVPASEVRSRSVHDPAAALQQFGATLVVKGRFAKQGEMSNLVLTLIDPKKMREIGYVDAVNQAGDLASLEDEAVTRLGRLMNLSIRGNLVEGSGPPVEHSAYQSYLAGLGYFQRYDKPGNLGRAIHSLEDAVHMDPHFAPGFAGLAQAYAMQYRMDADPKWVDKAQESGQRALALDDRIAATYVALAEIHAMTGRHDLAVQEYQRAVALDPMNAEAVGGMAESYGKEGRNADAEAAYQRAAALRPDDWTGYNALGLFYESIGRPESAIAQYRRALELTPDNAGLYINLGNAYMDLTDPRMAAKADEALRKSIAIGPTFIAWADLGYLYLQEHRFQESVTASEKALAINDQNYDIWGNLADAREWLKDESGSRKARDKATALLEQSVKVNGQSADARALLARLLARNGERDAALEQIRNSLALSPTSQYVLSQVADAYELLGDRENAIRYLTAAITNGLPRNSLSGDPYIQGVLTDPRFLKPAIAQTGPGN